MAYTNPTRQRCLLQQPSSSAPSPVKFRLGRASISKICNWFCTKRIPCWQLLALHSQSALQSSPTRFCCCADSGMFISTLPQMEAASSSHIA